MATVPSHVSSMIVGGGCGQAHVPDAKGEIKCKACAPLIAQHTFAPAPEGFTAPETTAPASKSKKSAPADDAAPSA
ncbi:MAG TPA: hypothetical protein VGU71_22290 [Candidatus Dormibacteraeota bacterium]|nr:hypothetical protein [Candidatus Dormibacteraeota bacterium]